MARGLQVRVRVRVRAGNGSYVLEESEAVVEAEVGAGLAGRVGVRERWWRGRWKAGRFACQSKNRLRSSAGEMFGIFGPARGCPGVWLMLIYFMAILGVSEAASRINIALVSFTFFRAATNVNGEYSSEIRYYVLMVRILFNIALAKARGLLRRIRVLGKLSLDEP